MFKPFNRYAPFKGLRQFNVQWFKVQGRGAESNLILKSFASAWPAAERQVALRIDRLSRGLIVIKIM